MMRGSVRWAVLGAASAGLLLAGGVAGIAQDKAGEIKARQDFMKAQGSDVKAISQYSKGQGEKAAAEKAIDDLLARNPKILDMFPAGTSSTDFPGKTGAKPELWTDWNKFKMIPTALKADEEKLKGVIATGDRKAVGGALAAMGKSCDACHGPYRLKSS